MQKKVTAALAGLATMFFMVLTLASPAQAVEPTAETKVVQLTITDRDDSGFGTPTVWAKDTLNRKVTVAGGPNYYAAPDEPALTTQADPVDTEANVCDLMSVTGRLWKYTVKVEDTGTFVTTNASATGSPGYGASLIKDATGTINGGAEGVIYAPAHWCSWTGDAWTGTKPGSETGSTGQFLAKLFSGEGTVTLTDWGWLYERCQNTAGYEKWHNFSGGKGKGDPNSGDITGKACPTASPSKDASSAPAVSNDSLPVTGVQTGTILLFAGVTLAVGAGLMVAASRHRRAENQ